MSCREIYIDQNNYILDCSLPYSRTSTAYSPSGSMAFFNFLMLSPAIVYGTSYYLNNYDDVNNMAIQVGKDILDYTNDKIDEGTKYLSNKYSTICAWAKGLQRYNKDNEEVFELLHQETGTKFINQNGRYIIAEGYFVDDKLRGPGNIDITENNRWIESKGIYKNNKLNGPGTYEIGQRNENDEWITGVYTGTFKNNNLHGKGKFENDYICVEGEFKNGYIQEGTIKVKEYNEDYMDRVYKNRTEIKGVFSGKNRLSQDAYVECIHLNGRGEMKIERDGNSIIECGNFREGRLHGEGKSTFKLEDNEFEVFSLYQNGVMSSTRTIVNNGVELRVNDMGYEFIYKEGTLNVDNELETFKLTFSSGDMVVGEILNKNLMKIQTRISETPMYNLNPEELKNFVSNTTKSDYVFCKDRELKDLNSLELLYWLISKDRELYNQMENKNLNGETYINLEKSEDSEDSLVVVSD